MTGLLLHSRTFQRTLATMEHQDNVARLISEMPRVRSPRRRTIEIQEAPHAAPVFKPLAKPLVFRKTKRELEREQQQAQALQQLERMQSKKRRMEETRESINRARPKCAHMGLEELVVTGAYVLGAVCIVLLTLTISWLVVWKCVLAKMPFIQELFDLKPKKPSAHEEKSISFQDRYQAYKRKRHATRIS
ncbi:hypothetical protein JG687_00002930 [Phytophthora cactorum]|uniref:Transmembrane protein n=2 Tax=Phytophthora cactorum TaxID=29920 RepID=A0A8T1UX11_9STRA|nr:hypothetical protein JG687_00002930 [Phytophthora cactorum]